MTTAELKYELFKDIDSINDDNVLNKIAAYIRKYVSATQKARPALYDAESGCYVNEKTMEAIEESMRGTFAGEVDCSSFEAFEKSLGL